jgi:hypothetical protein
MESPTSPAPAETPDRDVLACLDNAASWLRAAIIATANKPTVDEREVVAIVRVLTSAGVVRAAIAAGEPPKT